MSANAQGGNARARRDARGEAWSAVPLLLFVATAALPACLAASHALGAADAAHDAAVVRALGLGWTGAWRALDVPWCGLFAWLPVGTRALRAALASSVACGAASAVIFAMTRAALARRAEALRLGPVVAAIAALSATLSPGWQLEASAPVGATLGGLLALVPVAIVVAGSEDARARGVLAALALGLGFSYEPFVGIAGAAGVAAFVAVGKDEERIAVGRAEWLRLAGAFAVGLAPLAIAFATRRSVLALAVGPMESALGERGVSAQAILGVFLKDDVGVVSSVLAGMGAVVGARAVRARPAVAALGAVVVVGVVALLAGVAAGPTRYGAPVLAGIGAGFALAGVALQEIAVTVAEAKIPFAKASAAMIVLLEASLPARAADDASVRLDARGKGEAASEAWGDAAWGPLPAGAVVLVRDREVERRLYASRAAGELRGDLALVPMFDLAGAGAMGELARDPKLSGIWRDAALLGVQEEWSLSSLAQERPLVASYDQGWDRTLARHLVPVGLFARFEPEPRGGSDRRRAMEAFSPAPEVVGPSATPATAGAIAAPTPAPVAAGPCLRDRLASAIDGDLELRGLTTRLLRTRLVALAAASERDVVAHAIEDLRPFSSGDKIATELQRRLAASHGAIDVKDLAP